MEVALLPLPTSLRAKLFAAGHYTTTTLLFLTPLELARGTYECISLCLSLPPSFLCGFFSYQQCRSFFAEAQLSNEEALSVLKLVPRSSSSSSSSDGIFSASSALDGNSLFALISIAMATAHAPAHFFTASLCNACSSDLGSVLEIFLLLFFFTTFQIVMWR